MTPQDLEQLRRLAQAVLDNEDTSSRDIARRSFGTPDVAVRVLALLRERDRTSEGDGMEYREMSRAEAELEGARRLRVVLETGKWPSGNGITEADRRIIAHNIQLAERQSPGWQRAVEEARRWAEGDRTLDVPRYGGDTDL